ncbi:MAG: hypothetical protein UFG06_03420 [Lachnospiraceae bacterium]|nr:hypothetical protein [Lachnospiraceae bacterium]
MKHLSIYNVYIEIDGIIWIYNNKVKSLISLSSDESKIVRTTDVRALPSDLIKKLFDNKMIYDGENETDEFINSFYEKMGEKKLNVMIMASTACNFDCIYCYENYEPKTIDLNFSDIFLHSLIKSIESFSSVFLEWFGGEPLLAKKQIIYISNKSREICRKNKKPFVGAITTNGYYLNYDTFSQLIDGNIIFFQITLDGVQDSHDKYRPLKNGEGSYIVIFNNLLEIKKRVSDSKIFRLTIRNNVSKENALACQEFKKVFNEYFGDDNRFQLFQYPIKDWGGSGVDSIKDQLLTEQYLPLVQSRNSRNDLFESVSSGVCVASKKYGFVIEPDYGIFKCNHYIQGEDRLKYQNRIGRMDEKNGFIIDEKKNSNWIHCDIKDICAKCEFLPNCILRCPLSDIFPYKDCKANMAGLIKDKIVKYIGNQHR